MPLFPIFVKLERTPGPSCGRRPGRRVQDCGTAVGRRGGDGCCARGNAGIQKLAGDGTIIWHRREFEPNDLDGMALAVAAVPKEIAALIYEEARARDVLVNSVDDPDNCDFYYPAVVNRGDSADRDFDGGTQPGARAAHPHRARTAVRAGVHAVGSSSWARPVASCLRRTSILSAQAALHDMARLRPEGSAGRPGDARDGLPRRRGARRSRAAHSEGAAHPRTGRRRAARRFAHAGHSRADSFYRARSSASASGTTSGR